MSILIEDPEILAMVNKQIAGGNFLTPGDAIRSALLALEEKEEGELASYHAENLSPEEVIWVKGKVQEALDSIATEGTLSEEEVFASFRQQAKNVALL